MTATLSLSLSGSDSLAVLHASVEVWFADQPPSELRVDGARKKPGKRWLDWAERTEVSLTVRFGDDPIVGPRVSFEPGKVVKLDRPGVELAPERLLAQLGEVPFELAVGASIHVRGWRDAYPPAERRGFAGGHYMHGWMCGFRQAGHRHLVSRRWLDHGPWRLIRDAERDLSLVQFHQLGVDAELALDQARPGHQRMGISDSGGFVTPGYSYQFDLDGTYDPDQRSLTMIRSAREVSQREMLDACAMRRDQLLGPDRPIERVRYLFAEPERARAHLHELWLRELECWTLVDGRQVRLDDDYRPVAAPPAWAR